MTSLGVNFFAGDATFTVVFDTGFTTCFATELARDLAAGFATGFAATFAGNLFLLAGAFTTCLLWALACG